MLSKGEENLGSARMCLVVLSFFVVVAGLIIFHCSLFYMYVGVTALSLVCVLETPLDFRR